MTTRKAKPQEPAIEDATYHHGNLRTALLEATLQVVEEQGVAAVSVRDLAKRLGVSPAAPFRHFANKKALLAAVAEEAMHEFADVITRQIAAAAPKDGLREMGRAYLRWALTNRAKFEVISDREGLDLAQSASLLEKSETVMRMLNPLIIARFGEKKPAEMNHTRLVFRGFVYGLARMAVDRHLDEWRIPEDAQLKTVEKVLDTFLDMLR